MRLERPYFGSVLGEPGYGCRLGGRKKMEVVTLVNN